jgi:predicted Zn-dependent protease
MTSLLRWSADRPVMTRENAEQLQRRVIALTSADAAGVFMIHSARVITRWSDDAVLGTEDGADLEITVVTQFGGRGSARVSTNQLDDTTLRAVVHRCEAMARMQNGAGEELYRVKQEQDEYLPVTLWHGDTVRAMQASRETVLPEIIGRVRQRGLRAAGFLGLLARAQSVFTKEGIFAFNEETDGELVVTARGRDGRGSGWAGAADRNWTRIDHQRVADEAARIAAMNVGARAFEPGRRTVILSPAAVAQIARYFAVELLARDTDGGHTGFSRSSAGGNKIGTRVFDRRITMRSDPADPEGGYSNYFGNGKKNPQMTWVDRGMLRNLSYDVNYAMTRGKQYSDRPYSLRIDGGKSSIESMILSCTEGIYVNRLSSVDLIDGRTGLMTGVTRDGCFLVRNGRIDRPVKNFRFVESPFFMFNKLIELGPTARAPFGYTPAGTREDREVATWPRRPMIVPPMMVEDFNFSSIADTV